MSKREQLRQELEQIPEHLAETLLNILHQLQTEAQNAPIPPDQAQPLPLNAFVGLLKNFPSFSGDPVTIQRQMRDEWD